MDYFYNKEGSYILSPIKWELDIDILNANIIGFNKYGANKSAFCYMDYRLFNIKGWFKKCKKLHSHREIPGKFLIIDRELNTQQKTFIRTMFQDLIKKGEQ